MVRFCFGRRGDQEVLECSDGCLRSLRARRGAEVCERCGKKCRSEAGKRDHQRASPACRQRFDQDQPDAVLDAEVPIRFFPDTRVFGEVRKGFRYSALHVQEVQLE